MQRKRWLGLALCFLFLIARPLAHAEIACPTTVDRPEELPTLIERLPDPLQGQMSQLYAMCGYSAIWYQGEAESIQAETLRDVLSHMEQYGLSSGDYVAVPKIDAAPQIDLLLSIAALEVIEDLRCGRRTAQQQHADIPNICSDFDVLPEVRHLAGSLDLQAVLRQLEPSAPGFVRSKEALRTYLNLAKTSNSSSEGLEKVKAVLMAERDLDRDTGDITMAIRRFQRRHGLADSGTLDRATLQEINVLPATRVQQLSLTLERWRWIARAFSSGPVVVNVPEFRVRAYDDDLRVQLDLKVIVGKAYRHKTPVFQNEISAIMFRPNWYVPQSIIRNEFAKDFRNNAAFLSRNGYEVMVDASGRTQVRQRSGENNALGLIKFSLPNNHSVYLHDTPHRELFERVRRDFSHGCIRVQSPELLATWLLRHQGWSEEQVVAAMHGTRSFAEVLKAKVPVLIVYGTAFAAEDGLTYFLPDIYGLDRELQKQLDALSMERNRENAAIVRRLIQ